MAEKIDVVYKLGAKCQWGNYDELRYSLRSLSNFKDLGKVYIIGHQPAWIKNVIFIPFIDSYKRNKDANLINKLIFACYDNNLSQEFLNFSDDQFLLKQIDRSFFKDPLIDNTYLNFIPGKDLSKWQTRLQKSITMLRQRGYSADCFESHCPCLIDKTLYPKTLLSYDYGSELGMCGNTLYYNTLGIKGQVVTGHHLAKFETAMHDKNKFEQICNKAVFLNIAEQAINDIFKNYVVGKFQAKSIYES